MPNARMRHNIANRRRRPVGSGEWHWSAVSRVCRRGEGTSGDSLEPGQYQWRFGSCGRGSSGAMCEAASCKRRSSWRSAPLSRSRIPDTQIFAHQQQTFFVLPLLSPIFSPIIITCAPQLQPSSSIISLLPLASTTCDGIPLAV